MFFILGNTSVTLKKLDNLLNDLDNVDHYLSGLQHYLQNLNNPNKQEPTQSKNDLIGTLFEGVLSSVSEERIIELEKENKLLKTKVSEYKKILQDANKVIKESIEELNNLKKGI